MEFLLLLWDELDDLAGVARHVARSAVAEAAALTAPLATAGSAVAVWFLVPHYRVAAALLGFTATFWGAYRQALRLAGG